MPKLNRHAREKRTSSAIAQRPRCRVGQFWPKVQDDILQTIQLYLQPM